MVTPAATVSFSFSFGMFFQSESISSLAPPVVEQHCDDGKLAGGILVHEMGDHGITIYR